MKLRIYEIHIFELRNEEINVKEDPRSYYIYFFLPQNSSRIQNLSKKALTTHSQKEGVSGFPVQTYKRNIYRL